LRVLQGLRQVAHVVGALERGVPAQVDALLRVLRDRGLRHVLKGGRPPGEGAGPVQGLLRRAEREPEGVPARAEPALVHEHHVGRLAEPGGLAHQVWQARAPLLQLGDEGAAGPAGQEEDRRGVGRPRGPEPGEPDADEPAFGIGPVLGDVQGAELEFHLADVRGRDGRGLDDHLAGPPAVLGVCPVG
jgi:hypothetical protein